MNKNTQIIVLLLLFFQVNSILAQVAINTSGDQADASSMLDVKSTDKGMLIPRMSKALRDLISSPATGLLIYQTDNTPGFYFYDGSAWVVVGNGATTINSLYDGKSDGSSVFLGINSGTNDDATSNQNLGFGINALNANTNGYENTAIGIDALKLVDGGHHNTALGIHSLSRITTGSGNTALGTNAGISNTGSGNIFIGANAAYNELGSNKLYIENSSSASPLVYGEFDNNLIRVYGTFDINNAYRFPVTAGTNGQLLKTDGSGNLSWADDTNTGATSINELSDASTDNNSLFLGIDAGGNDDGTTNFNTGTGVWSLKGVTSGSHNSAFGTTALQQLSTGNQNTAFGMGSLNSVTTNSNNTAIGKEAGKDVTGSGNVFIGNEVAKTQTNISNKLFIDNSDTVAPLIYGDFENDTVKINAHFDVARTMSIDSGSIIGQLAINTDGSLPSETAILDLKSSNKGFLLPRMSLVDIKSIELPENGLMVYNTDDDKIYIFVLSLNVWKEVDYGSNEISLSFVDTRDGHVYKYVIIGNQAWMAENLNFGTEISESVDQTDNDTIEKYCAYDYLGGCGTWGGLYIWDEMMQYVTTEGTQGICPVGWHLPSQSEWSALVNYLGGYSTAGGPAKEAGTVHWEAPNTGATNSSGFAGLPGGFFMIDNSLSSVHKNGFFWSSSEHSSDMSYYRSLWYLNDDLFGDYHLKGRAFSVRCIKD